MEHQQQDCLIIYIAQIEGTPALFRCSLYFYEQFISVCTDVHRGFINMKLVMSTRDVVE